MARLLVVEDDEDVRALLDRRLSRAGHDVAAVSSAEDALTTTAAHGLPDVAVLDVGLPGMSGLDLAVALQAYDGGDSLRVVFLSANVLPEQVAAGLSLGAQYLLKPYVLADLFRAVDDALVGAQ